MWGGLKGWEGSRADVTTSQVRLQSRKGDSCVLSSGFSSRPHTCTHTLCTRTCMPMHHTSACVPTHTCTYAHAPHTSTCMHMRHTQARTPYLCTHTRAHQAPLMTRSPLGLGQVGSN